VFSGKVALTDRPSLHEAPEIIKPLEAQVAEANSTVVLEVEYTGVPQPEVQWFRNGKKITPSEDITISDTKTTLTIKKINRKSSGRYEVRVSNVAGEAKTSASVTVVGEYLVLCTVRKEAFKGLRGMVGGSSKDRTRDIAKRILNKLMT
jgi:hypothetical protein